jgi:elongation factor Ts
MNVEITAKMVNDLRVKTGAGLMACKKALVNSNGDIDEAIMALRKAGEASAEKKAERKTDAGLIEQYIHLGGKVGVLVEVNCETDFVAKTEDFKTLTKNICLQIAASNPICLTREEVAKDILEKEREVAAGGVQGKPANIVEKIVQGKLEKVYSQLCLLEQSFIKDPSKTIKEILAENTAKLGENIIVKRFVRYEVGQE